jgi:hypothetical protein
VLLVALVGVLEAEVVDFVMAALVVAVPALVRMVPVLAGDVLMGGVVQLPGH